MPFFKCIVSIQPKPEHRDNYRAVSLERSTLNFLVSYLRGCGAPVGKDAEVAVRLPFVTKLSEYRGSSDGELNSFLDAFEEECFKINESSVPQFY